MKSGEIRKRYLDFFEKRGHKVIPSSSLVPENDPTTLFTGSGMQPMVGYLLGEKHPYGTRLTNSQRCFRSVDIEEVGDNRHTTMFEMLGNWSLGDYFKDEQLDWIFTFLTDELGIDPERLYVTVFSGDKKNNLPRDTKSVDIWKTLFRKKGIEATDVEMGSEESASVCGMQEGRIFYYDSEKNWWSRAGKPEKMPAGEPGGPDSEIFFEFTDVEHDESFGKHCHPNCDCGRFLEIGNSVFMEYRKREDSSFEKLPQQNVDFGGGLERLVMVSENTSDIILTNHDSILEFLEKNSSFSYEDNDKKTSFRIIADHMKAAVFLIADGVKPSNTDQGYFVRRLIRRSVRHADTLGIKESVLSKISSPVALMYKDSYPDIENKIVDIEKTIKTEEVRFRETLNKGLKEFEKGNVDPFVLFTTYGFPFELTKELADEKGIEVSEEMFKEKLKEHQEMSRSGSEVKFKGGLGDTSDMSVKYHTATHLLNAALKQILGTGIYQKGSNITSERMRFDFSYPKKLTDEQKKEVEHLVNEKILADLLVSVEEMDLQEAYNVGATGVFGESYPDRVKVYTISDKSGEVFSREICGGPHVSMLSELGTFRIKKEESVASGVRRIKAVLN